MKKSAICLVVGVLLAAPTSQGFADTAKPAAPVVLTGDDADRAIKKADAFLSTAQTMVGDFVQAGADGRQSEGKIYIQNPGRLRF